MYKTCVMFIVYLLTLCGLATRIQAMEAAIPTSSKQLIEWLQAGSYRAWPSESKRHRSQGPHFGDVRTYVNPSLFESLQSTRKTHPQGAAAVKELYNSTDGTSVPSLETLLQPAPGTPIGWAVSIKLDSESTADNNWYWFEFVKKYQVADGVGEAACIECHQRGRDYILTDWPFRF